MGTLLWFIHISREMWFRSLWGPMDFCHLFLSVSSEFQFLFPQHYDTAENILVLIRFLLGYCVSNPQQFQNLATVSRGKLCQPCFFCLTLCPGREPLKSWLPLQPQTAMLCLSSLIECQKYCFKKPKPNKTKLFVVLCLHAGLSPTHVRTGILPKKKKKYLSNCQLAFLRFFFYFLFST